MTSEPTIHREEVEKVTAVAYFFRSPQRPIASCGFFFMVLRLHTVCLIRVFVTLLCAYQSALAQLFPFDHYTTASGLLSNSTTVLFQDSRGFLHIGSSEGLSTFDGYTFTHTRTRDGLPSNYIYAITEQSSAPGVLWIGTANGIAILGGRSVRKILLDTSDRSRLVYSIQEDWRGRMWCGTHGGLYVVSGESVERVPLPPEANGPIEVFPRAADSLIWVRAQKTLLAFTPDRRIARQETIPRTLNNPVSGALRDGRGRIWIGQRDGTLSLYDNGTRIHQRLLPATRVRPLVIDHHGRLYLATDSGIVSIAAESVPDGPLNTIGVENGLPGRLVLAGVVDSEGDLWFALQGSGVARLRSFGLLQFPIPEIYEAYNNMRATCGPFGHYWVISGRFLVELWRASDSRWYMSKHKTGLPVRTTGVLSDGENVLRVVFQNGDVHRFFVGSPSNGSAASRLQSLGKVPVRALSSRPRILLRTRTGRAWWTDSLYLVASDGNVKHEFLLHDVVGDPDVRTLYEDSKGNIWVGGFTGGIAIIPADLERAVPRRLVPHKDIPAGFIRAFCEDGFGRIWVGTRYAGCMIISDDGIRVLSSADILPSDAVWTITRDHRGTMWLGTSEGFVAVDPSTLQRDPIGNDLPHEPVLSSGVSEDGTLWFVTPSGFGVIDRDRLPVSTSPLTVRMARVEVNGQTVETNAGLEFSHTHNNWTFTFLASTLRNAREILYQYRLIGADEDWRNPTRQRTVAYASLRPGTYTFEVRATRGGTQPFGPTTAMTFTITPPFWESAWFRVSTLAVLVAALYLIRRRKIQQLERESAAQQEFSRQLLESQENERKRIAGELHDSLVQDLLVAKNRTLMGLRNVHEASRVQRELEEIASSLSSAIEEVREIAHNLRPYQIDRLGFSKAVRSLLSKLSESSNIRFEEEVEDVDAFLNEVTSIQLYRILQEAVNNVLKHSNASKASVTIRRNGRVVQMTVKDDGKGIARDGMRGFGLEGIARRTQLIGGTFELKSVEGEGTLLVVTIPAQDHADGKQDHRSHR